MTAGKAGVQLDGPEEGGSEDPALVIPVELEPCWQDEDLEQCPQEELPLPENASPEGGQQNHLLGQGWRQSAWPGRQG